MTRIAGIQRCGIEPNEIIVGKPSFWVEVKAKVSQESSEAALGIRGVNGNVRVSKKGRRLTWSPECSLKPGFYELLVGELSTERGRRITAGGTIPFRVVNSKASVSRSIVVEHMVRLRLFDDRVENASLDAPAKGSVIDFLKCRRRGTLQAVELSFDGRGERVDASKKLASIGKRRLRKARKVHPHLAAQLEKGRRSSRIPVAIWMKYDDAISPEDELKLRNSKARKANRAVSERRKKMFTACGRLSKLVKKYGGTRVKVDSLAPVIYARVSPDTIETLRKRRDVLTIFHADVRGIDDLEDSIEIAGSDHVHDVGEEGDGTRVAVWERGPDVTTNLDIEDQFDTPGPMSGHSRLVHGIIKNIQAGAPNGHAPECLLYSANSYDRDALRWAVEDQDCTVINQSFHRTEEQTSGDLSFDDVYKDWLALNWPYPTILQASGNDGSPDVEFVNHKGYNSLTVGNHNDDASSMSTTSVYRNPTTTHSDRELPEICANGTSVTAVGRTDSGTSFASPAVAGISALLQSTNTSLRHWPEGNRAILLAGATRNVTDSTWWDDVRNDVDAADGTGAVNAIESHRIAKSRRSRNNNPSRRGWDIGLLRNSDFDSSRYANFSYWVRVPKRVGISRFFLGPRRVKIALAWTSEVRTLQDIISFLPAVPFSSALTVDLDLRVFDSAGNQVASSLSWDNSYEIAEFDGEPGAAYRIRVHRWSGDTPTWFGLAWTVTGGFELLAPIDVARLRRINALLR